MKKIILTIMLSIGGIGAGVQAQKIDSIDPLTLNEVVISANRDEDIAKNVAQSIKTIRAKEIQRSQSHTTADLLSSQGVFVQRSQLGGGSPVLRGFEASRIMLVLDGVRMNNLIYRAGHLQDIVKTDPNSLEAVEIMYGPSSTIYGSDALGGVIHMQTKDPKLSSDDSANTSLGILARYESAAKAWTTHAEFNYGKRKFASLTSFSYSKYNDLMGGKNQNPFYDTSYGTRNYYSEYLGGGRDSAILNDNPYLQIGTGYSQYDIHQKFVYMQNSFLSHNLNLQYSNTTDVPRYDRLTDPGSGTLLKSGEWYYGPQSRALGAYDLNFYKGNSWFDVMRLSLNYQQLQESRHNRNFNSSNRNSRTEDVNVGGLVLHFNKKIRAHQIRYGIDAQMDRLKSSAFKKNIVTDVESKLDTRYPDGTNRMDQISLYITHNWKINNYLSLVDGLRGGYTKLHSTLKDTALLFHLPYTDIEQNTPTYSGNLGLIHTPDNDTKFSLSVSTGYRVPNVDDLSKIFASSRGNVIVPNKDLKPESTINYEFSFTKIIHSHSQFDASIYYTDYRNIAVVDKFTFNGQDSILYDGTWSRVLANQNKEKAFIYGCNVQWKSKWGKHFTGTAGVNYTYGRIKTENENSPLDHIPPLMGRGSMQYQFGKMDGEIFLIYCAAKRLKDYYLNGEDNEQYATPDGMPAWMTLNLRLSYLLNKQFTIQCGVDNLFDTQYRVFASGINAPGRNLILALRANLL